MKTHRVFRLSFVMVAAIVSSASAAPRVATWTGGSGIWSTASMWDINEVPNNGADTYSVLIDGGNIASSTVTLLSHVTISGLTIDYRDQMAVDSVTLTLASGASVTNSGNISLGPSGCLALQGDVSLGGTGTISGGDGAICSAAPGARLTVGAGQYISGARLGTVANTLTLTNNGTIDGCNICGATGTTLYNAGTIQATAASPISISNAIIENTGGTIRAHANRTVNFIDVSISNGQLLGDALTGSFNFSGGCRLSDVTMVGQIHGGAMVSGTITNNATYWWGTPTLEGPTTIDGTGVMVVGGSGSGYVYATNGTDRLTIGANQWLKRGTYGTNSDGSLRMALTNHGTIEGALISPIGTFYNSGTVRDAILPPGSSRTVILDTTIDNTGGVLLAEYNTLSINHCSVTGGSISAKSATIEITNGSTITTPIAISAAGSVQIMAETSGGNTVGAIANNGTLTVSDPAAVAGAITGTGLTTVQAGASLTAASVRQNALTLQGNAAGPYSRLTITQSGTDFSGSDAAVSVVKSLAVASGSDGYRGTIDLTNNDLIIDYTGSASPLAAVEAMVRSGFYYGLWTGKGITSSVAAANSGAYALVVLDNAQRPTPFTTFDGIAVPATVVIVKFSWIADLDLDGIVTSNDAIVFANNYAEGAPANHRLGDLDYNGVFDSSDAILFATAYNESLPHLPEPVSLALLAIPAATLVLSRRTLTKYDRNETQQRSATCV